MVKPHNFYVYVRGNTDDLYNCLPGREGVVEETIIKHLREGDTFIDVGANIGYYTLLASKLTTSKGFVVSFEPVPETFSILLRNIKINDARNVLPIQKAGWSSIGKLRICMPEGWYGLASAFFKRNSRCKELTVEATPIDAVVKDISNVKLMKIDVEGSEYEVLKGLSRTLDKTSYIILEVSRDFPQIFSYLLAKGFSIKKLRFTTYVLAYRKT